jgi:hypothetical protein
MPGFEDWTLCGGHSVALFAGVDTRPHGDIDVGVFRSQVEICLRAIGADRVFLCRDGRHHPWDGSAVPLSVHDIWITDRAHSFWAFQVMIFDDDRDHVIFRRDRRIRWRKSRHSMLVDGVKILNPFVTFLFKAHKSKSGELQEKEVQDLVSLIENGIDPARRRSANSPEH